MANPQITMVVGVAMTLFVFFVFAGIWASRYRKVGPNQALIVSGRTRQLPDGTRVGFRIVKGGGTFVFPIYERVDVLSLEVTKVEMEGCKIMMANGTAAVDCLGQVKIKGDDVSLSAAMEYFLTKSQTEMKELVRPIFEKHLIAVLSRVNLQQVEQDRAKYAADIEGTATLDLGKMGLSIVSFSIQGVRAA
jgi:flotillin